MRHRGPGISPSRIAINAHTRSAGAPRPLTSQPVSRLCPHFCSIQAAPSCPCAPPCWVRSQARESQRRRGMPSLPASHCAVCSGFRSVRFHAPAGSCSHQVPGWGLVPAVHVRVGAVVAVAECVILPRLACTRTAGGVWFVLVGGRVRIDDISTLTVPSCRHGPWLSGQVASPVIRSPHNDPSCVTFSRPEARAQPLPTPPERVRKPHPVPS